MFGDSTERAYKAYFGMKFDDQDKSWPSHQFARIALKLYAYGRNAMRFGILMVWRESQESP